MEGLIDIENPNRVIQTTKKVTQLDLDGPKELSRRERWVFLLPWGELAWPWGFTPAAASSLVWGSVSLLPVRWCFREALNPCCPLKLTLSSSKESGRIHFISKYLLTNFSEFLCFLGVAVSTLGPGSLARCAEWSLLLWSRHRLFLSWSLMPKIRCNQNPLTKGHAGVYSNLTTRGALVAGSSFPDSWVRGEICAWWIRWEAKFHLLVSFIWNRSFKFD